VGINREYRLTTERHNYQSKKQSHRWAILGDWKDRISLIFLFLNLGVVVLTVQQAKWIDPQPSLFVPLILSIVAALIFLRSRLSSFITFPLAVIIGAGLVFFQCLGLFPDIALSARFTHMITDIGAWVHTMQLNEPSPGIVHIALVFGFLAWIIGYFSAWVALRWQSPWVAISLGAITILVNLNFWSDKGTIYFLVYLISSLLLIAILRFIKRSSLIVEDSPQYRRRGWIYWGVITLCLIVIAVGLAWPVPQLKIYQVQSYAREVNPWRGKIDLYWQNFFAPVPSTGAVLAHGGQTVLKFGGSLELTDKVAFIIKTDKENYWKTQVYDYYDTTEWKVSETQDFTLNKGVMNSARFSVPSSDDLSYVVIPQVDTNVLPVPGELISGDFPITKKVLNHVIYTIDLTDATKDKLLPPDLAALAVTLRNVRNVSQRNDRQITSLLPVGDFDYVNVERENNRIVRIFLSRTSSGEDMVAITGFDPVILRKGYQISARVPGGYTRELLSAIVSKYPADIADRYLQLPAAFPARVKDLAVTLTSGQDNAYDKAQAIKNYLSQIKYSLQIEAPPEGADGVEYFLFTQKSGYCTYFASSMTVMLRSVGIPARMAVGYLSGQYDPAQSRFILRDKDYHAWTEVYFPGYGWVLFDPTASTSSSESTTNTGDNSGGLLPPEELEDPFYGDYGGPYTVTPHPNYTMIIVASILFVVLLAFSFGWFMIYRRPESNSGIYSRMVVLATISGLGPRVSQTVLEYSEQMYEVLPEYVPDIKNIASVYLDVRYGKKPLDSTVRYDLTASWRRLRTALVKHFFHIK
jgi:transglutaminase-like putative cysteine protease